MKRPADGHAAHAPERTPDGTQVVTLPRPFGHELFITTTPVAGESSEALLRRAATVVQNAGAHVVSQEVYGIWRQRADAEGALAAVFGPISWPVTWIPGHGLWPKPDEAPDPPLNVAADPRVGRRWTKNLPAAPPNVGGIQTWAVAGVHVAPLELRGRPVGSLFEDDAARYCRLGNILPADPACPREEQARNVLEQMEAALHAAGFDFRDTLRTWFGLDDILPWYDRFNRVRNAFFQARRVFERLVPASTGVGARLAATAGSTVVGALLAVRAKSPGVSAVAVPSPLQGAALEYGSSFSRAVELTLPDHRRLFVSGTASIAPDGRTAHPGDLDAQVALTLEVVHAILTSRGLDWPDVTRAIAHFKRAADIAAFHSRAAGSPLATLPVVFGESELCRGDLLFELELDAARSS
jgi:enamine deaminase RidA (YjgF/YER057c/UK114 family)